VLHRESPSQQRNRSNGKKPFCHKKRPYKIQAGERKKNKRAGSGEKEIQESLPDKGLGEKDPIGRVSPVRQAKTVAKELSVGILPKKIEVAEIGGRGVKKKGGYRRDQ